MPHGRDSQRQKVYRSERMMSTKGTEYATLDEVGKRANKIALSKWWGFHFGKRTSKLAIERGRGGAKAIGGWMLRFGKSMQYDLWIMDELAHIAAWHSESGGHGPEFTRAYLLLVRRYMGAGVADELRMHMKACGVKITRQQAHAIWSQKYKGNQHGVWIPKNGAFPPLKPKVIYEDPQPQNQDGSVSEAPEILAAPNPVDESV